VTNLVQDLKASLAFSDETFVVIYGDDSRHWPARALDDDNLTAKVDSAEQMRKLTTSLPRADGLDHGDTS